MGYRSHGTWVIKGSVEDIRAAWITCRLTLSAPADTPEVWGMFRLFQVEGIGYIRFGFEDWKWYESYSDIIFYESVWTTLEEFATDDNEQPLSGKCIRIGEDNALTESEFGPSSTYIYVDSSVNDEEPANGEPITTTESTPCSTSSAA